MTTLLRLPKAFFETIVDREHMNDRGGSWLTWSVLSLEARRSGDQRAYVVVRMRFVQLKFFRVLLQKSLEFLKPTKVVSRPIRHHL